MMRNKMKTTVATISILVMCYSVIVQAKPKFPEPPGSTVTWIGKDVVWNGIPMQVRKFTTTKSRLKTRDFYKKAWKRPVEKGKPGFIEDIIPDAWLISRLEDGYLMTVQIKKSGLETWGYLGLTNLEDMGDGPKLAKRFPKMSGSQIMNEVKHNDPYRKATTIMLANNYSVSSNVEFYRSHYQGAGWNVSMDQSGSGGSTHTFIMNKRGAEVSLTVVRTDLGSQIVANIVE